MKKLSLFDMNFIDADKALYFDDKHNSERVRSVIISDTRGCKVGGSVLAKDQLKYVMNKAGVKNISSMLNPSDKQNVPSVLGLYKALEECVVYSSNCADDSVSRELKNALQVLYHIFDGVICIFADPEISLATQLKKLSKLSHILLAEYRSSATTFIPGQSYHDIQCMVQGCFYACLLQKRNGGGRMYLYQLGTDQLEKLFGVIRTLTHARNCDSLEICQRLSHAQCIQIILQKNPEWKRVHGKRLCGPKDASSEIEWKGELEVKNCDIMCAWKLGELEAIQLLNLPNDYFSDLNGSGVTMLRPNKRLVGVNVDTERNEVNECNEDNNEQQDASQMERSDIEDNLASLNIEELIEDEGTTGATSTTIELDGKNVHKATVVKEMFNSDANSSSNDRLRRVRGYSKNFGVEMMSGADDDIDLDECVMIGDTLATKVQINDETVGLCIFKVQSIKDKDNGKFETVISGVTVGRKVFSGTILEGKVIGNNLSLKTSKSTREEVTVDGVLTIYCKIQNMLLPLSEASSLMETLPLHGDGGKTYKLLPYHPTLTEASQIERTEQSKYKCKLCNKLVNRKKMRQHVGSHIVKDGLTNVCGFCGVEGNLKCKVNIVSGSGRGKSSSEVPNSSCDLFEIFSIISAAKRSNRSPCTNRPVHCPVCRCVEWSYNMVYHCQTYHSDYPRDDWTLCNEEEMAMKKL